MLFGPIKCVDRGCKHFAGVVYRTPGDEGSEVTVCQAFREGIPDEIAFGENLHLVPIKGQGNKIVFEEEEKK